MKISVPARRALAIGTLCASSYLAVYFARNVLSAVSPQMQLAGYSKEYIGSISANFFLFYAFGQLFNGWLGDRIKARYMISFGLLFAGIANYLVYRWIDIPLAAQLIYGAMGVFLAMIYGPMTKVVAENTDPPYTVRCSIGYTFSSLIGSPLAGLLAAFLTWHGVFVWSSITMVVMATLCFTVFLLFEKRGMVRYRQYTVKKERQGDGIRILIRHGIVRFSIISILTGVIRSSVVFWLPTYLAEHLGFSSQMASLMFTVGTLVISVAAFLAIFVYEKTHENMNRTIFLFFSCALVLFVGVYLVSQPTVNMILIIFAILSSNCVATMLWSKYCPSLRDTGMVSGATGFLDCLSYIAAGIATRVFAYYDWNVLILIWCALMAIGVLTSLPYRRLFRKSTEA